MDVSILQKIKNHKKAIIIAVIAVIIGIITIKIIAKPDPTIPVDAVGMDPSDLELTVKYFGRDIKVDFYSEFNDTVEKGKVARTVPGPGESYGKGSTVEIYTSLGSPIKVPNCINKNAKQAEKEIKALDLYCEVVSEEYSESVETGAIIKTDPEPETEVAEGQKINLTVSKGSEYREIPVYSGIGLPHFKDQLKSIGLSYTIEYVFNDEIEDGIIISCEPGPGTQVEVGSEVKITVSKGHGIPVPDVIGLSFDEAVKTLKNTGFSCTKTEEYSDEPAGTVIYQQAEANTLAKEGDIIELGVSKDSAGDGDIQDADILTLKALSQTYNCKDILRNPDNYKDLYCKVSGTVSQTFEGFRDTIYIIDSSGNIWGCKYFYKKGESHMLDGDKVTVYGILNGTNYAYNAVGDQVTFPYVNIKYYEIN